MPNTLAWTISPIGAPSGRDTMHPRLHDLGRPGEHQHRAARVPHLEVVGEVLVELREQPDRLLQRALPDLHDRADLLALPVVHGVLVGQLDQLRLLGDDEHRLLVQRRAGPPGAAGAGWRRSAASPAGRGRSTPARPTSGCPRHRGIGVPARRGRRLCHGGQGSAPAPGQPPRRVPDSAHGRPVRRRGRGALRRRRGVDRRPAVPADRRPLDRRDGRGERGAAPAGRLAGGAGLRRRPVAHRPRRRRRRRRRTRPGGGADRGVGCRRHAARRRGRRPGAGPLRAHRRRPAR